MISIQDYIGSFKERYPAAPQLFTLLHHFQAFVLAEIELLNEEYAIRDHIAIHHTAVVEQNVTIKAPAIIGPHCFIGANAYLRDGVILEDHVRIGTGCEIKSSLIGRKSAIAHFNFIGDSLIGSGVNFEAGSVTANYFNERKDKRIFLKTEEGIVDSGLLKMGAIVGDRSAIGANAVLSPGTLLKPDAIVKRMELIEQIQEEPLIAGKYYIKNRAQMIRNYIEGYNQFDIDKMMLDIDPHIVFENIQHGERKMRLVGIETFREQAEEAKQYFTERTQSVVAYKDVANETEIEIDYHAILAIDLPNGLKSGQELRLKGKSVFTFQEDKIIKLIDMT